MKWQINLSADASDFFPHFFFVSLFSNFNVVDGIPVAHVKVSERANSVKVIIGHI